MLLLDNAPHEFVMQHQESDLEALLPFVHRTFNGDDFIQFIACLQHIYKNLLLKYSQKYLEVYLEKICYQYHNR